MDLWESHARRLADGHLRPESPWWKPVATTPRHLFVPNWWERGTDGRVARRGPDDPEVWLRAAYRNQTLVTRIGADHADQVDPGTVVPYGRWPTSSSTLPSLMATMYRHAMLADDSRTLVTTGTGYGTALACSRLGDHLVTSVDVDPYLVEVATDRLAGIGLHPRTAVCDITGTLPGDVDRIVSSVAVRPVPASWLAALRPGGRLVTTITGTAMILVADKTPDGGARGFIASDQATFMRTRHGDDYEAASPSAEVWKAADEDGDRSLSRYPLTYVPDSWAVQATLELEAPGIEHRTEQHEDGGRTVWMAHPDGSWARASTTKARDLPTVHQGGDRRLWDLLTGILDRLIIGGELPVNGARVTITPDGQTTLSRGRWSATL
ncbi:protein-L-isoaspartate(D-aspartate) O-methyltransferase [Streptomyces sp. NPDC056891]|uniref:protein-L-isoaspartate(D-aspartate) O-methyltransferase n=1 Tax=Streptomyces sp. NPDC056891 TaxID=3345961 RepID=UPI00368728E2